MPSFARIAVNVPSRKGVFDYRLPLELEGNVHVGHLVTVPFGRQTVQGVILELVPNPAVAETKTVISLLDPLPVYVRERVGDGPAPIEEYAIDVA